MPDQVIIGVSLNSNILTFRYYELNVDIKIISATRTLECKNHGLDISRCSLQAQGRQSELNPGCFDELDEVSFICFRI